MHNVLVSPSILGVKKEDIVSISKELLNSNASLIHFDVMDGIFVSNKSFLENEIDLIQDIHDKIIDVHLMCKDLNFYIPKFMKDNVKYITFHYEALEEDELIKMALFVKEKGYLPGLAINPETDVNKILKLTKYFSLILVMSVHPGRGGQSFIEDSLNKIEILNDYRNQNQENYLIEVDGGINDITSKLCIEKGVDILVSGSYILKSENYLERIKSLL